MTNAPLTTTLKEIRSHNPCVEGWQDLLQYLGKSGAAAKECEEPLPILTVLESNGTEDAIWVLEHCEPYICRLLGADYAERVLPIFLKVRPDDDRPARAIAVARDPNATKGELGVAGDAARAAAWDAWDAARAAAWAAWAAAGDAARAAAWAAAWAAWAAAWAAAGDAAWAAARAARAAAWAAAWKAQTERLKQYLTYGAAAKDMPWPEMETEA